MGAVMMARPAALAQPEAGCCERTLARAETVLTELRDRWGRPEHGLLWSDIFRKLREVSPLPEQRAPESESVKRKPRERCSFCQKYVCEWDCPYAAPESEGT